MRYVEVEECLILKETDEAFLVEVDGGEGIWLPKSAIETPSKFSIGDEVVTLSVARWLAEKEGLT